MAKPPARMSNTSSMRLSFFGPPALLEGENAVAYDELLAQVSGAVNPGDIFEEIWVRDIVDLSWEISRLRRFKSQLLTANVHRGLRVILEPICGYREAEQLSADWAKRENDAVRRVDELLAGAGLTMNEVMAEALAVKISDIERIDRLIMNAEARRNAVLREVERHRTSRDSARNRASGDVEDAEVVEVTPIAKFRKAHGQRT